MPLHDSHDLAPLLRAGTPMLVMETTEERAVVEAFRHALTEVLRPLYRWSITEGLQRLDMDDESLANVPPDSSVLLQMMRAQRDRSIYLLFDFHQYLRYATTVRQIKELVQRDGYAAHTIVLIGTKVELPEELAPLALRFQPRLPDEAALATILREEALAYQREHGGRRVEIDRESWLPIIRTLLGLSVVDARKVARQIIFRDGQLNLNDLSEAARLKFRLLNQDGLLHFEYDTASFADVAGLERLKRWIELRRPVFLGQARAGLDPPKGLLMLGVQGCGKSLAAKAVAGGFRVPLLRLDFGALYNKYHGETERNLRESLRNAELMAPCVLWIDEIEKGVSSGSSDDGVSQRVLGYLLTWMAERKKPVFLVATANQIRKLPPELLRKGRFDEIFFVDLPDAAAREEIFRIHLRRRELRPEHFDLPQLAAASDGFSGAEIEQAVVSGLYAAHGIDEPLDDARILEEIRSTRPLSRMMAEEVASLRAWARERTVPA